MFLFFIVSIAFTYLVSRATDDLFATITALGLLLVWFRGFVFINGRDKGVRITIGNPDKFVTHENGLLFGLHWILWPLQRVIKYPRAQQSMDFTAANVITNEGEFEKKDYGSATVDVDSRVYFLWPDNELLSESYKESGATDADGLKEFVQDAIIDAFRKVAGSITWRELVIDQRGIEDKIENILSQKENPVSRARLIWKNEAGELQRDNFNLTINNITLPKTLSETLTSPEIGRLEAEAVKRKADGEKYRVEKEGEAQAKAINLKGKAQAEARDMMLKVIKEYGADYETLFTLREMATGTSNTIVYQLPQAVYDSMTRMLGGTQPEQMMNLLPPDARKQVEKLITELLKAKKKGGK